MSLFRNVLLRPRRSPQPLSWLVSIQYDTRITLAFGEVNAVEILEQLDGELAAAAEMTLQVNNRQVISLFVCRHNALGELQHVLR